MKAATPMPTNTPHQMAVWSFRYWREGEKKAAVMLETACKMSLVLGTWGGSY